MELIRYQKTLDVHKNGTQFVLQGFETSDRFSRVIEISLMASGDAIDFPLERIVAMIHVTVPGAEEPSIYPCNIKDNKIIYNVVPIKTEGITEMQIELIETDIEGAKRVLASPKFAVEVFGSKTNEDGEELTSQFTAIQDFIAKAEVAYGSRIQTAEVTKEGIFRITYYDGTIYESDFISRLCIEGNVELCKSFAVGGTGIRTDEDRDNAKYYSSLSRSEALYAKEIMEGSEKILAEVKTHGVYTAFTVNFDSGELEYVSSSHTFSVDEDTGELIAEGATGKFEEVVGEKTEDWLIRNDVDIKKLKSISNEHENEIEALKSLTKVQPIANGGTGATTKEEALENLGVTTYQIPWNVDKHLGYITPVSDSQGERLFVFAPESQTDSLVIQKQIFMKNSGRIYFDYWVDVGNDDINLEELTIKLNSDVLKTYASIEDVWADRLKTHSILLDVKKEDVITILVKGTRIGTTTSPKIYFSAGLKANVETPYTYRTITEGME